MTNKKVLQFIERFKKNAGSCYSSALETVFTCGNCYWFAVVLTERFKFYSPKLYYYPITGHFAEKISDSFYDITGEIQSEEKPIAWETLKKEEPTRAKHIYQACALLTK